MEHYAQKPNLVILTGPDGTGKKKLAKMLEQDLLNRGRIVYYMGMGSYLYGIGADTKKANVPDHTEQIRRFAEVANLMLDAGIILFVTVTDLTQSDYKILQTVIEHEFEVVWIGKQLTTNLSPDMQLADKDYEQSIHRIKGMLKENDVIFKV